MPIQHAIWRIGDPPVQLVVARLFSEQQLEDMIVADPGMLSSEWMLIGRQEVTSQGGRVDLLAIAPDASLVLIELKRNRTPREIVAQALDYASWVERLGSEHIAQIYHRFSNGRSLDGDFQNRFGNELDEDALNESHQIVIVAAELDDSTERIISYLNARDIAINILFFQVFQHGDEQLISRAWLIDPGETQANVASTTRTERAKEPWNGEYYVSFGDLSTRDWEEARKYGFISGGGGRWYSHDAEDVVARGSCMGQHSEDRVRWRRQGHRGGPWCKRFHRGDVRRWMSGAGSAEARRPLQASMLMTRTRLNILFESGGSKPCRRNRL